MCDSSGIRDIVADSPATSQLVDRMLRDLSEKAQPDLSGLYSEAGNPFAVDLDRQKTEIDRFKDILKRGECPHNKAVDVLSDDDDDTTGRFDAPYFTSSLISDVVLGPEDVPGPLAYHRRNNGSHDTDGGAFVWIFLVLDLCLIFLADQSGFVESGRNFVRSWFNITGEFLPDQIEDKNEIKVESNKFREISHSFFDVFQIGVSVWNRLYDYQRVGVSWCWELFKRGYGGILGDDMGLGKTVQTAVFLRGLFKSGNAFRVLIISPLSVMNQWESELRKWCPRCRVVVFHGSSKETDLGQFAIPTVVLSTYDTFRNAKSLCVEYWHVAILDEAHRIKNPKAACTKAVLQLRSHCRLLLTGTPLMNRHDELWSLFHFAQPGLLADHRSFKVLYGDPIRKGSLRNATPLQVELKKRAALQLRVVIAPHFLRRQKEDVFLKTDEGPCRGPVVRGKVDVVIWLPLSTIQWNVYERVLNTRFVKELRRGRLENRGICALQAISLLKKVTKHPILLLQPEDQAWRVQAGCKNRIPSEGLAVR
ncbi:MAG: hypothetical protein KVP17_000262 [Porospora cf. gigantea B]|uniref:uncharacterized protein n=1 Tax=Porospora cf. gigantea B TaxID=2853592 RepID=UPI003571A78A|nr:MAG: hypothetical protein KVP17_000262 [Porospora cf. gigantea B]